MKNVVNYCKMEWFERIGIDFFTKLNLIYIKNCICCNNLNSAINTHVFYIHAKVEDDSFNKFLRNCVSHLENVYFFKFI